MYRVVTQFQVIQQPTSDFPNRTKTLTWPGIHELECEDSWSSMTNKAKVTIPRNVSVRDENNRLVPLGGTNINAGGFSSNAPLFLRGDKVSFVAGYRYYDRSGNEIAPVNTWFEGYISNVNARQPIVLECEDNMYILKRTPATPKTYLITDTLETMLGDLLAGTPFTYRKGATTTFGNFKIVSETVGQVLARIEKDYNLPSYFKGNELRCGFPIYDGRDTLNKIPAVFQFQANIISDELNYKRIDDIDLSAIVYSTNKVQQTSYTKDGNPKTKSERLEVWIGYLNGKLISKIKPNGNAGIYYPVSECGEQHTFCYDNVTDPNVLISLGTAQLQRYHYTGYRGKFRTFGLPNINQGDNVEIRDNKLPERNGVYRVKSVKKFAGSNVGLKQEIELDFKLS